MNASGGVTCEPLITYCPKTHPYSYSNGGICCDSVDCNGGSTGVISCLSPPCISNPTPTHCSINNGGCSRGERCRMNAFGGVTCVPLITHDECAANTHKCDKNASCENTKMYKGAAPYNCHCNTGYVGNGFTCEGKFMNSIIFQMYFNTPIISC